MLQVLEERAAVANNVLYVLAFILILAMIAIFIKLMFGSRIPYTIQNVVRITFGLVSATLLISIYMLTDDEFFYCFMYAVDFIAGWVKHIFFVIKSAPYLLHLHPTKRYYFI